MRRPWFTLILAIAAAVAAVIAMAPMSSAQPPASAPAAAPAAAPPVRATPVAATAPSVAVGAYEFAPGVLTTIAPALDRDDAISIHDIPEIRENKALEWEPSSTTKSRTLFEMAKDAVFANDVWCLELSFKPLRMIEVDVPQPTGRLQRKRIWYMVYRVRNTGAGLAGEVKPDGSFATQAKPMGPLRFIPEFVLVSQDRSGGQRVRKAYLDRLIPAALEPIRQRELPRGELKHSAEISLIDLKVEPGRIAQGAWGVAMWEDIDPQIDFFSVFVRGLSNGYKWSDLPGAYKLGDAPWTGRKYVYKTLQLNFWRPGDEVNETERGIHYGPAPQHADFYDSPEGVAYQWVYR
jgi:hypothetical protein